MKLILMFQIYQIQKEIYLDIRLKGSLFEKQFNYLAEYFPKRTNAKQKYHFWSLLWKMLPMAGFFKEKRNEKLDKSKQMGLIGELTFLKKLFSFIDIRSALDAWKGPDKYAKDFLISSNGLK